MFAFTNRYCSEINDNTATLEERIDAPRKLPSGMKTVLLSTKIHFHVQATHQLFGIHQNTLDSISTRKYAILCQRYF